MTMLANAGKGLAANRRIFLPKGVEPTAALMWALVCVCYWLYPLWPRGYINWNLKFALLAAHTVFFLVVLRWWSGKFARATEERTVDSRWAVWMSRWGMLTLALIVVISAVQLSELHLLITSGTDEPYRIMAAFEQWQAIAHKPAGSAVVAGLLGSVALLCFSGLMLLSRGRGSWKWTTAVGMLLVVALALHYETVLALGSEWGGNPRWPPLGTILEVASLAIFGAGEAAARLPSLAFFALSGVYLFRLVRMGSADVPAFAATAFGLTAPAFVLQGQLASREPGGAFFLTAAAFYLARWWRSRDDNDFGLTVAMILAGYFVRRPVIVFAGVVAVVAAVDLWRRRGEPKKEIRRSLMVSAGGLAVLVAAALPWAYSTRTIRPFEATFSNWLELGLILAYPARFPAAVGLVATVCAVVGVVALLRNPRIQGVVAVLWLAATYVLFTSDTPEYIPTWRFLALMSVPVAALAGEGVGALAKLSPKRCAPVLAVVVFVGAAWPLVAWNTCAAPLPWRSEVPCRENVPRYPFKELVTWFEVRAPETAVVSAVTYWQTALGPYLFLADLKSVEEYVPVYGIPAPPLAAEDLIAACRTTPANHLVIPYLDGPEGRRPVFMSGSDSADGLELLRTSGFGGGVEFANGRHVLVLYPCPSPGTSDKLEASSGDHDHPQQEPTP